MTPSADSARLQRDLDNICTWYKEWRMNLNQSKCTCLSFTRCTSPIDTLYYLEYVPVKVTESQKDLGILITPNLKWNLHLQSVISKAIRMLGFVRRSCFEVKDPRVRKSMVFFYSRKKPPGLLLSSLGSTISETNLLSRKDSAHGD